MTYRVIMWVVWRFEGLVRFFAIARVDAPLTGAFVPLVCEWPLIDYVELFDVSQDMNLKLLGPADARCFTSPAGTTRRRPATFPPGARTGIWN